MNENFVIISNIEWNFLKQRHQFLAERIAERNHNVIFIESSAKRNPKLSDIPRIIDRLKKSFKKKNKSSNNHYPSNIKIITPIVLPSTYFLFRFLNSVWFINPLIKKIKGNLITGKVNIVCYLPSSTSLELIQKLKPDKVIYDCVSNFDAVPGMPKDTPVFERKLIEISDIVFTDCDFLFSKHYSKAKKCVLLEPGVEYELFDNIVGQTKKNGRIKKIGYYGLISKKIDFNLLELLNSNNYKLTMIGDVKDGVDLPSYVEYYPAVNIEKLPEYLKHFDALIIPYVKNEFMRGVIPAKFFECFATGLPLIVTKLDNYKRYLDLLITGEDNFDILNRINNFEFSNDKINSEKRMTIAKAHSWDNFIKKFFVEIN